MANNKKVVGEFCDVIKAECEKRWGEEFTVKDLVYHLSEKGIIPPQTLRNYMLFEDFDKYLVENGGHVGNTFIDLSIIHNLSEKQCRNIIYKHRYKFLKKTNIL